MSEYQYYHFQAVDRPLDEDELRQLRSLSSRASITPTTFVNGDFKGDPRMLMEKFFDAFVYVSNWGARWLMFRLPLNSVDVKSLARYCVGDGVSFETKGEHVILEFFSEAESDDWEEGEGWLATLIPLRNDILCGDLRPLYLAWLLCVQDDYVEGEFLEPPLPSGLKNLSASLRGLAEFLRLDKDLIEAAAQQSDEEDRDPTSSEELLDLVRALEERKKDDLLFQVMEGKGHQVQAALLKDFRQRRSAKNENSAVGRSVRELLSVAETITSERDRQAAAQALKEQQHREKERELAKAKRLEALSKEQAAAWCRVEALIETKQPKKYDEAVNLLRELHELGIKNGKHQKFASRLEELLWQHRRKPSLLERLDGARLGSPSGDGSTQTLGSVNK